MCVQRLGELAVSSAPMARSVGLEALRHTLADRSAFYRQVGKHCLPAQHCLGCKCSQTVNHVLAVRAVFYRPLFCTG